MKIFNHLKWKYPSKGELPTWPYWGIEIPIFAHVKDDHGNEKYGILLWDPALKNWVDPQTDEINEDVECVYRWEYLGYIAKQIKG